ncbi:class I SAM-dependent methyltransferase [Rhizobium sp. rho-13.1]|uniref:class I SAM-dependent methyltransferase n=1 Tax=Rhizobium sp. rho-13.1 TaxID=2506431 RepID=UPI0013866CD2|nr:class I SAM-dependent methyltransferase [Rhizobium sp. rho-13.1]
MKDQIRAVSELVPLPVRHFIKQALFKQSPYMRSAIPNASDFDMPEFAAFCASIDHALWYHRKIWEWAFIEYALKSRRLLREGKRGLCFGVGNERLPALFASKGCTILATDGPEDVVTPDWNQTGQYAANREVLHYPSIIGRDEFERRISFAVCDMNNIDPDLRDFDFCWSACCLEHLGSLQAGEDFILNSVETLRPGGIAVHTTELNLSSDVETISTGHTVLYRRADIEAIKDRARTLGHIVYDFPIVEGDSEVDQYVDIAPFRHDPHLRLQLEGYTTTSIGIVIQRCA